METTNNVLTGCVKWFNSNLNYGFITVVTDGEHKNIDVFCHQSNIKTKQECYRTLDVGECVQFELAKSDNIKHPIHAVNITGFNGGLLHCETVSINRSNRNNNRYDSRGGDSRDSRDSRGGDSRGGRGHSSSNRGFRNNNYQGNREWTRESRNNTNNTNIKHSQRGENIIRQDVESPVVDTPVVESQVVESQVVESQVVESQVEDTPVVVMTIRGSGSGRGRGRGRGKQTSN